MTFCRDPQSFFLRVFRFHFVSWKRCVKHIEEKYSGLVVGAWTKGRAMEVKKCCLNMPQIRTIMNIEVFSTFVKWSCTIDKNVRTNLFEFLRLFGLGLLLLDLWLEISGLGSWDSDLRLAISGLGSLARDTHACCSGRFIGLLAKVIIRFCECHRTQIRLGANLALLIWQGCLFIKQLSTTRKKSGLGYMGSLFNSGVQF